MHAPKAAIFGCSGLELTADERQFFERVKPLGFILFARNCESPEQVKRLVADLKSTVPHTQVPVLIDQEGGRVARLKPPHWRAFPTAERFVNMAKAGLSAERACYLNARLIAAELYALGINTNCAPVADLRLEGAHDIIGDRAFGSDAAGVVPLARAQAQGLMDGGVIPVLKHIPGHGRALVDSHESLPIVDVDYDTLDATDFAPFKALADLPMAMTAHVRYQALDADLPATLSPHAIRLIRETIGFGGLLMTDDMSMKALKGDIGELSAQALAAGCDVVLHCNGQMEEMQHIAAMIGDMGGEALARAQAAFGMIAASPAFELAAIESELVALMPEVRAA